METKFNSQICTTREQSERLLALGLKKETADMVLCEPFDYEKRKYSDGNVKIVLEEGEDFCKDDIPAWSLHRLLSLLPKEILCEVENGLGMYFGDENAVSYFGVLGYYTHANLYDAIILCIEDVIKEGYFNKEYLD